MITRTFKLCLNAGTGSAPYINVSQYDEGETWLFELYSETGERYIPTTGAIVGVKSDGHGIANTGTVDSEGRVVIAETQQMTASAGRAIYELSIDGLTHGTANFIVAVERKPTDDAVMSDSDLSLIQEAVDAAEEIEDLLGGQDVPTVITPIITDWLDDNITNPSNPPIDTSLTVAGAAADAKKTGDEITDLKSAITYQIEITEVGEDKKVPFYVFKGDSVTVKKKDGTAFLANSQIRLYSENGSYIGYYNLTNSSRTFTYPNDAVIYYVAVVGAESAQDIVVTNNTRNIGQIFYTDENEINDLRINTNELNKLQIVQEAEYNWQLGALNDNGSIGTSTTRMHSTYIPSFDGAKLIIEPTYANGINVKVVLFELNMDGETYKKIGLIGGGLYASGTKTILEIPTNCYAMIGTYYRYDPTLTDSSMVALGNMMTLQYSSVIYDISTKVENLEKYIPFEPSETFISEQRDLQNNDTILFAWASDTHHQIHVNSKFGMTKEKAIEFAQVANAVKCDFLTVTGDIVNGYYPVAEQKANLIRFVNAVRDHCDIPCMMAQGNHDDNSWYASANGSAGTTPTGLAQVLQNDAFTSYSMNNSIDSFVFNVNDPLGGYYYKDFSKCKIRAIVLNCEDIPYIENQDLTLKYNGQSTMGFRQEQLNWLANSALKFDESGWGIMLFMHYDGNMANGTQVVHNLTNLNAIITAFSAKTSGTTTSTDTDFELSVSYDFTANASDDVIAWFSGHRHDDASEIIDGVPHLRIINPWNETGGGYDIVTVDRQAKKIYTRRFNGEPMPTYDRTITWQ